VNGWPRHDRRREQLTVAYVAHYHYGLSRLDIRTSALTGAAIFALIFAMLVATELIKKKSK
jgi:hypothetical protein